jgi:hypothetical protein
MKIRMEKMNLIIFLFMMSLTFSQAQLSKQNLNLNHPRKLEEKTNETILLGFENYNFTSPYDYVYFDTLFYLKNWNYNNTIMLGALTENNFTIDALVYYEKINETNKFNCSFDDDWFNANDCIENEDYSCVTKYKCELNITGKGVPKKINITTNFTNKDINNISKISYVSSSAEALKKDLVSLKYQTERFRVLKNANFTSQSPNSFKIKVPSSNGVSDSENIYLITTVNNSPKKILCSGKFDKDSSDDMPYYFIKSKGSNNLAGANLNYALLNYTTGSNKRQKTMAVLDFAKNSKNANGTILPPKVEYKKNSGGLSTGGICAVVIPSVLVLLGVGALVFFLSRRAVPSPPIKTIGNNTMGVVASSESALHQ